MLFKTTLDTMHDFVLPVYTNHFLSCIFAIKIFANQKLIIFLLLKFILLVWLWVSSRNFQVYVI